MSNIIYFDGSCRNNGSPDAVAAASWVDETTGLAFSERLQPEYATNNRAEYMGLMGAIRHAYEFGYTDVVFIGDSKLVVEQMNGNWKVKDPFLKKLHETATFFSINWFESATFQWVPREENIADEVAAKATGRA